MAGAFRRRASELLGVPPEWLLAGNGSDDILTIVTRALVGEGQLLRLPYPSYILYRTLAELQGARSEPKGNGGLRTMPSPRDRVSLVSVGLRNARLIQEFRAAPTA